MPANASAIVFEPPKGSLSCLAFSQTFYPGGVAKSYGAMSYYLARDLPFATDLHSLLRATRRPEPKPAPAAPAMKVIGPSRALPGTPAKRGR